MMHIQYIFVLCFTHLKPFHIMKNYSRQLDCFINSKHFADSHYRPTDSRTYVRYYIDEKGLIHSGTFNYSLIGCEPVSADKFRSLVSSNPDARVSFSPLKTI